jgi:NDP-sugar pyrophosphorylase family protein
MKGMLLAAGFGTRFRPATYEIPKPMIPLCNRPLIGWALEAMLASGVREVVVNLHHLGDELEAFLRERYGSDCDFYFSREEEILGTGGGIRRVRAQLDGDRPFVLANADTVQIPPFRELGAACEQNRALAALLLRRPPANDRFTKVFFDGGRVTGFGEGSGEAMMFAGAHAISPAVFDLLPDREFSGITEDVYAPAAASGEPPLAGVLYEGPWFDIGTPVRYLEATEAVRHMMVAGALAAPDGSRVVEGSIVSKRARIEGDFASSVAAAGVAVERGASVAGSVLWDGAAVASGGRVSGSIVGRGVAVPAGAVVEGALVCRRLPRVEYPEGTILAGEFVAAPIGPGAAHVENLG